MHRSLASRSALALLFVLALAGGAAAQQATDAAPAAPCGGDLSAFLEGVKKDAVAAGASAAAADEAFAGAEIDPKVLSRDRAAFWRGWCRYGRTRLRRVCPAR